MHLHQVRRYEKLVLVKRLKEPGFTANAKRALILLTASITLVNITIGSILNPLAGKFPESTCTHKKRKAMKRAASHDWPKLHTALLAKGHNMARGSFEFRKKRTIKLFHLFHEKASFSCSIFNIQCSSIADTWLYIP